MGVSEVSLGLRPLRLLSTCQVVIFAPADGVTVIDAVLDAPDGSEALMVVEPAATAIATPEEVMVATFAFASVQVAAEVTSAVEPSLYVALAVNCWEAPAARLAVAGDAVIAVSTLVGLLELGDEAPPQPAAASSSKRQEQRKEGYAYS